MKKIIAVFLALLCTIFAVSCFDNAGYQQSTTNQQDNYTSSEQQKTIEEIILTKDNIDEYLKIDYSVDNISVKKSTAFNPPVDKGEGEINIKTKALKRGDFENVSIRLSFESERGWDPEFISLTIPFDGEVEETKELLSYSTLLFDNPRYEMTIISVSGKFVK